MVIIVKKKIKQVTSPSYTPDSSDESRLLALLPYSAALSRKYFSDSAMLWTTWGDRDEGK